ncbi:hypothetical protein OOZ63_20995 [Paucibacter sp. PLA-PC-4]|uniref:hypothetical protein n=1 Tax=Paucibacter sp. PLA-PC-4 TaxID=2993655 RepID=UPI00224AAA42|nr:hypothetical protein [Paucibacter sp. PLA-PC-4]MCX2864309.1 hypothetical protein [Paucibacter sp. PLA-PC-4]
MGIIDFREIVSPKAGHASSENAPIGRSNLSDDFEVFCQDFFLKVREFTIFKSVSKGPDGGIDLGVEEKLLDGTTVRWLVSCKHNAHSGKAVSEVEERNIIERVGNWECDGFIPFYTTVPAATVGGHIDGVEKLGKRVERFFKDRIERELLSSPAGIQLAARYFPRSMVNHYTKIIETAQLYTEEDLIIENGFLYAPGGISRFVHGTTEAELAATKSNLTHLANVFATMSMHAPYFVHALNDAIKLAPNFFTNHHDPAAELKDFVDIMPTWSPNALARASRVEGLAFMYFVASVWSFWDWEQAHDVFAQAMAIRSKLGFSYSDSDLDDFVASTDFWSKVDYHKKNGLLTSGLVALKLQEEARDVLARLVAFASPIPKKLRKNDTAPDHQQDAEAQ